MPANVQDTCHPTAPFNCQDLPLQLPAGFRSGCGQAGNRAVGVGCAPGFRADRPAHPDRHRVGTRVRAHSKLATTVAILPDPAGTAAAVQRRKS